MKKIVPFSNGTEAMSWLDRNCDICRRTACGAKLALQKGFVTGEITERMASFIGYDKRLNAKCEHFTTLRFKYVSKPKHKLFPKLFI